jgi:hypothetical protein
MWLNHFLEMFYSLIWWLRYDDKATDAFNDPTTAKQMMGEVA